MITLTDIHTGAQAVVSPEHVAETVLAWMGRYAPHQVAAYCQRLQFALEHDNEGEATHLAMVLGVRYHR